MRLRSPSAPVDRALVCGLVLGAFATGCSTTAVDLRYPEAARATRPTGPALAVGTFEDDRGTGSTHLGSIRSGIGSPMKRLVLEAPASEIVRRAFADGLRARGRLAASENASLVLEGRIEKLDCNQYSNREAHAAIHVSVVERANGRPVFSDTFESTLEEGGGLGGPFGSVEGLRALAERALREVVDAALDAPGLHGAVGRAG